MSYKNLFSALAIIGSVLTSLGCCCPARLFGPRIVMAPPPIVVQQAPPAPPAPAPPPPEPAPDVQQFINQNLGANTYAGALAPNSRFWETLRQKVANRQYTTNKEIALGGFGQVPFSETNADGGVIIGFFAGDDGNGHVGYLQPIYLTAKGEKVGQAYGVARRPLQCLKAKTGYALRSEEHTSELQSRQYLV